MPPASGERSDGPSLRYYGTGRFVSERKLPVLHQCTVVYTVVPVVIAEPVAVLRIDFETARIRPVTELRPFRRPDRKTFGLFTEVVARNGEVYPRHRQLLRHGQIDGRDTSRLQHPVHLHLQRTRLIAVGVVGGEPHRTGNLPRTKEKPHIRSVRRILLRLVQRFRKDGRHGRTALRQHGRSRRSGHIRRHRPYHIARKLDTQLPDTHPPQVTSFRYLYAHDMTLMDEIHGELLRLRSKRLPPNGFGKHEIEIFRIAPIAAGLYGGRCQVTDVPSVRSGRG